MDALFLKLVNLSITASWLVLAVLVLRLLFRKAPRWIFCLLWGLVALRLVCPISLESALSLIPSAETLPTDLAAEAAPVIDSGIPILDQAINPVISEGLAPTAQASVNPLRVVTFAASWVWLAGLAAMLLYSAVSFLLLKRRVRTATLLRDNIRQSEAVHYPFVLGVFRPVIYLPYSLGAADMDYVLAHERAHIRRRDHWWKPIGFLILAVYWFNPLMWLAYVLLCRDIELACDEKVVSDMDKDDRRAYSAALLNCSIRRRSVAACPLAFGEVGVKDRVKSVMNYKKPAFWIIIAALLACAAVAVCFLTVPKSSNDSWILAEDGSGLPAPQGGADPYADLEGAERAAAFLQNADALAYELSPILMYGKYFVPVMEYVPAENPFGVTMDRSAQMLELLHGFDLSALEPLDADDCQRENTISGVISVGDARCRVSVGLDPDPDADAALMFTFSDGTLCAFRGGPMGQDVQDIRTAISLAGSGQDYARSANDGFMTVTRLSTGESRVSSLYYSVYLACIFDNTVLLAEPTENTQGSFDFQVSFDGGATYLFDWENCLIQAADGTVYPLGGFEFGEDDYWPIRAAVLTGFDVS